MEVVESDKFNELGFRISDIEEQLMIENKITEEQKEKHEAKFKCLSNYKR